MQKFDRTASCHGNDSLVNVDATATATATAAVHAERSTVTIFARFHHIFGKKFKNRIL